MIMQVKAGNPLSLMGDEECAPLIAAYFELCHLKQLYRQGWLRRGVPPERCETIAEHSFGVALLALWLADAQPDLDPDKMVRLALLHDLGEVYAGDIIPADGMSQAEKHRREAIAVQRILARLPDGQAYLDLWDEFEAGLSPEARFVRQLDRLEMGLQAAVYQLQGLIDGDEFFASARQALTDLGLARLLDEVEMLAGKRDARGNDKE